MDIPQRRFLTADDFNTYGEDDAIADTLTDTFAAILEEIVRPVFDVVYPEFANKVELENVFGEGNSDVVEFNLGVWYNIPLESEIFNDISSWINEFAEKKSQIETAVNYALSPTLSDDMLHKHGLSEEQFIVSLDRVHVEVHSTVRTGERAALTFHPMIYIYLRIEDISAFEPEGIEAQRLRYNNLCITQANYPESEARDWAISLGIAGADKMTRPELCAALRGYHKF